MSERLADLFLALATAAETEAGGELHDLLHDAITVAVDMKHEGVMPAATGLH